MAACLVYSSYRMKRPAVFGMVLAGGEGKRLAPLTADRAKPAVPFGGHYRLIDFALSNLINGGYVKIAVLTQYKSHSLDRHVTTAWRLSPLLGNYVTPVPAQMRRGPRWFAGSADAIYQNLNLIYDERPDYICVFGADHVYRMDPSQMVDHHIASGAGVTVAGIRVPISQAHEFGVIETGPDGSRIVAFREKPFDPVGLPDAPDQVYASMGNYVFTRDNLIEAVTMDAADESSNHDIGGNVIPMLVDASAANVYDFATNEVPGAARRRNARLLLRRPHGAGVGAPSVQPVQQGVAHPDLDRSVASCEVREHRGRDGPRRGFHGMRWGPDIRRLRQALDTLAGGPGALLCHRGGFHSAARGGRGASRDRAQRHHRQERPHPGRGPDRTGPRPGP